MQKEIWKDIPNYKGYYQVSNLGRVKSLYRLVERENHLLPINEKILKNCKSNGFYYHVQLSLNGTSKCIRVHTLVAMAFLGHKPNDRKLIVDHINNNQLDNRLENLQIITARENSSKDQNKNSTSSKYVGVYWNKNRRKWISMIRVNKTKKYLGGFDFEYDAYLAYQKELKTLN